MNYLLKPVFLLGLTLSFSLPTLANDKSCLANESFDDLEDLTKYMEAGIDSSLPSHKQNFCKGNPRNISKRIEPDPALIRYGTGWEALSKNFPDPYSQDTLAFANPPGPVGGGMCWLHTRLQRSFTYLANYRPSSAKPSKQEAMEIIDRIVHRKGVTEIPGFKNLNEFSSAYSKELIDAIDGMGWRCVANPNDCAARLTDSYSPTAGELKATMERLYQRQLANHGDIQMLRTRMLSAKGKVLGVVTAHSMLVLSIEPIRGKGGIPNMPAPAIGYKMRVIDPNHPSLVFPVEYMFGETSIYAGFIDVIPYMHYAYDGDIPEMRAQIDGYCKK
ncbi:MAG TPA: hypothetical protein VNJ08_17935 [Bacteriovoracaceae bacterium]|nr:hypothetical protein [Bacteriovoracaceae bacterium]